MPKKRVARHSVTQPSDPSYRLIPLTQGQNAIVDAIDFERVSKHLWYAQWNKSVGSFYATRKALGRSILLHRFILSCMPGESGDHKDGNTLDNRRLNLRKCSYAQNRANQRKRSDNSSGYKGVCYDSKRCKWRSTAKNVHVGYFSTNLEAAHAYDEKAKELFGEFAKLNFPPSTSGVPK